MPRPRLLVMGRRRGALLAAARLDAEVLLLDDGPRPHRAAGAHGGARVGFDDLPACAAAALRLAGDRPVDGVLAVVERAVLPAAAVREALGLPGATLGEATPWRDKVPMKERVSAASIPTAAFAPVDASSDAAALIETLGLPMVIKPRASSGSRGTVVAWDQAAVRGALHEGQMAESFVDGVEMSVESLVQGGEVRFENITEYLMPGWANVVPAELPPHIEAAVRGLNQRAIDALGVTDAMTHLEVFVRDEGPDRAPIVVFGELAARPPGGFIMDLIGLAYGFDPWLAAIEIALGRPVAPPREATSSAGVWFLHPGEGELVGVHGLDEARALEGVVSVNVTAQIGERVARRAGVGEHKGRVLVCTASRAQTVETLLRAHGMVRLVTRLAA